MTAGAVEVAEMSGVVVRVEEVTRPGLIWAMVVSHLTREDTSAKMTRINQSQKGIKMIHHFTPIHYKLNISKMYAKNIFAVFTTDV